MTLNDLYRTLGTIIAQRPDSANSEVVVMEENDGYCWMIDNIKYDPDENEACILVTDEP